MSMQTLGYVLENQTVSDKIALPHETQTKGIAIAMVTGQSGKVAAVVLQKLHSVVGYILYFSNICKILITLIDLSGFVSVLMQYVG